MSENKKVISREYAKEYKTKDGTTNYSFKVKFEGDEKTYQYSSTVKDDPPYFKVGEVAEFNIEEQKYEKDGTTTIYYKVKPVTPKFGGKGNYPRKTKVDYLTENLSYTQAYFKDLIVADKIAVKDYIPAVEKMLEFSEKKIKEYLAE